MIVVTGTPRSGTSLWMQILRAAGLPVIGDAQPASFRGLREANLDGFWESRLRQGIYFRTNPDPETGIYLHPHATRTHTVKVFIPGLVRTDIAFLDRVIATVRPWREFVHSMRRLQEMEDRALLASGRPDAGARLEKRQAERPASLALAWWFEVYDLVRDAATRAYPCHMVSFDQILRDPTREIGDVLDWVGEGDAAAAVAVVQPERRTQESPEVADPGVDDEAIAVFDAVYEAVDQHRSFSSELLSRMNALQQRLRVG